MNKSKQKVARALEQEKLRANAERRRPNIPSETLAKARKNKGGGQSSARNKSKAHKEKHKDKGIVQKVVKDIGSILSDDDYLNLLMRAGGWVGSHLWDAAKIAGPWALAAGGLALAKHANPFHPTADVPSDMRMSARVVGANAKTPSFTDRPTILRQHFIPKAARLGSSNAAGGIGFASDVKLTNFESSAPVTTPHGTNGQNISGRAYLFPLPATAVRGELIASVPLDMAVGLLATSRMQAQAVLYNRVKWVGFSLIYVPTCAVDTDGAIMIIGASDPRRTIASFPAGEARIVAATQYGSNSAMSRVWEPLAFSTPLDDGIKYQNMQPVVGDDERFVSPGIVELLCTSSWTDESPGWIMFEYDAILLEPVPAPFQNSSTSSTAGTLCQAQTDGGATPVMSCAGGPKTVLAMTTLANNWPTQPTNDPGAFSVYNSGRPDAFGTIDNRPETLKWKSGSFQSLGFAVRQNDDRYLQLYCPIGTFSLYFTSGHTGASGFGPIAMASNDDGSTTTLIQAGSDVWGTGTLTTSAYTLVVKRAGAVIGLELPHISMAINNQRIQISLSIARVYGSAERFPEWVVKELERTRDPFYKARGGFYEVDSAESSWLGTAALAPADIEDLYGPPQAYEQDVLLSELKRKYEARLNQLAKQ